MTSPSSHARRLRILGTKVTLPARMGFAILDLHFLRLRLTRGRDTRPLNAAMLSNGGSRSEERGDDAHRHHGATGPWHHSEWSTAAFKSTIAVADTQRTEAQSPFSTGSEQKYGAHESTLSSYFAGWKEGCGLNRGCRTSFMLSTCYEKSVLAIIQG